MVLVLAPVSAEKIADLLRYNPDTGRLSWRVARPPRMKAGDKAGTINPDGYIVITVDGQKVLGHYAAWAIYYGEWPDRPIRMRSAADRALPEAARRAGRADLRLDNLAPDTDFLDLDDKAVRRREEARRHRAARSAARAARLADQEAKDAADLVARGPSAPRPEVFFASMRQQWFFRSPFDRGPGQNTDFGPFENEKQAKRGFNLYVRNREWLAGQVFPEPDRANDPEDRIHAGALGVSLSQFRYELAYNPDEGDLIWRQPTQLAHFNPRKRRPASYDTAVENSRMGLSAITFNTSRKPVVMFHGRKYPAQMVIWFMTRGYWPKRKSIQWVDGNPKNLKLANLAEKLE